MFAMDEIPLVGGGEPRGRLERHLHRLARAQPVAGGDDVGEAAAGQVLRDEVGPAVGAGVVHGEDVGVLEPGRHHGLPLEALQERRVVDQPGVEDLDGDVAAQGDVVGQVDPGEPARAEWRHESVPAAKDLPEPFVVGGDGHSGKRYRTARHRWVRDPIRGRPARAVAATGATRPPWANMGA